MCFKICNTVEAERLVKTLAGMSPYGNGKHRVFIGVQIEFDIAILYSSIL